MDRKLLAECAPLREAVVPLRAGLNELPERRAQGRADRTWAAYDGWRRGSCSEPE